MRGIDREILRLSIPTIVSNVTVPLLGLCDTAISGHLGSELYLSAIAVASVMLNVVFWIFGFLRGGTTGLTANALGAHKDREVARVFYRAVFIGVAAGIGLIILQRPLFSFLWWITGSGSEIHNYVKDYFTIRIWGAPALLATMAISGWFVGMQTTFYPMLIAITTNLINITFSFLLAFPMGYGFNGVAMGTLISNWLGVAVAFGCVLWVRRGNPLKCSLRMFLKGTWMHYFAVNGNLFLRSFFIICVTMGVTAAGARLGTLILAVNVIIMQFFQFFSFFMDGIAFSGEALVGLRYGERNMFELTRVVRRLLQWTLTLGLVFSFLYFAGATWVASLLTESRNVIEGVESLWIPLTLIPIISCWAFIYDGFYIGITDTFKMMISTLVGGVLFFAVIGVIFVSPGSISMEWGNSIIWTAFLLYLAGRGGYLAFMWPRSLNYLRQPS